MAARNLISTTIKGDFSKTKKTFNHMKGFFRTASLDKYGEMGVEALSAATPKDTGLTASSWTYDIVSGRSNKKGYGYVRLRWLNSNIVAGIPVATLIQYGHKTRNGGFVKGRDFINPAMRPVFNQLRTKLLKEVTTP
jgi:hypothetical protein